MSDDKIDHAIKESVMSATKDEGESTEVADVLLAWFSKLAEGADPHQTNEEFISHVLVTIADPPHLEDED